MYRITDERGATLEERSDIKYVKMQANGQPCLCRKGEADGIVAADGETFYALKGRIMDALGGYKVVFIEEYSLDNTIMNNADTLEEVASDVAYLAVMSELSNV